MLKRVLCLGLCLLMIASAFTACAKEEKDEDDPGAYVAMYLTDPVYNFDPALAYGNESAQKVVSLMFDTLFTLNDKGKVEKSLADSYKVYEDEKNQEYKMIITMKSTAWSDGIALTANHVVYAWQRLLDVSNSFEAASLLYDIKNARAAKEGNASIDDVGISALNSTELEIVFSGKIDYDRFLLNLTSVALAPLRENVINQVENPYDWAKTQKIMVCSGPFKLKQVSHDPATAGIVLERNSFYFRNTQEDALDKSVTPFRLVIDYSKSAADIMKAYENGEIFYVGNIPLSVRGDWKDEAEITDALSTHTYVLNENAIIRKYNATAFKGMSRDRVIDALSTSVEGDKIFAVKEVRQALSLAIDREAIAEAVVFARAATALVPYGVFDKTTKRDLFREVGGDILATGAKMDEAKKLLSDAGVNPADYMFAITVASYDDVHMEIATMVQKAWEELGFHVAVNAISPVDNTHKDKTDELIKNIKDDLFVEAYREGKFYVAAIDTVAYSTDAFSMLAPYAKGFSGGAATKQGSAEFSIPTHISGFDNEAYNAKIEEAYATNDTKTKTALLHEAETMLMDEMPVIPIIFNQNATLVSDSLSKYDFDFYGAPQFKKLTLKDYELYLPKEEE